jgi:1-aminocyclopropane-1-carboxylate deaminase/D-cysteine desulfhydrase-like pyridoxal-dependent ACC family enzyme
MTIKATPAPAYVVRAFLNDGDIWKTVYCEEEEFTRDGERFDDMQGFSDADMVTITGGHVYNRNGELGYVGSLEEFFNQYLAKSQTTVVVEVDATRQATLLELLKLHGFEFSVVGKVTEA